MKGLRGCLLTVSLGVGLLSILSSAQSVNVTTWHNDNGRTGQNTNETHLNTTSFGSRGGPRNQLVGILLYL
jgi:hypothetical protein